MTPLDFDLYTPAQQRVLERAIKYVMKHYGFSFELMTEVLNHDLDPEEIVTEAALRNCRDRQRLLSTP